MRGKLIILFLSISSFFLSEEASAQSCSCGGAPLLGSLDQASISSGSWQLGITYDFNSISDLVAEKSELDDDTRKRKVHSALIDVSYGLSSRFSVTGLLTLLRQERKTKLPQGPGELLKTTGIGDGVLLLKYNLVRQTVQNLRQVTIGAGVKFPLGKSSLKSNSTLISADMQPGTGAWDGLLYGYFSQGFFKSIPLGLFASGSYRLTGSNDRFGDNLASYKFGDEFISSFGINYKPGIMADYNLSLRYRHTGADKFAGESLPNSGGEWLSLVPGVNAALSDALSARISGRIPLYRKLDGTQLTTGYAVTVSMFYSISRIVNPLSF